MEFDIEKCIMIKMKSGERETAEEIEMPNEKSLERNKITLGNIALVWLAFMAYQLL